MNHSETWQMEVYVPKSEAQWLEWAGKAEKLIGCSLDGDGVRSLDYAYDVFLNGIGPEDYAKMWLKG